MGIMLSSGVRFVGFGGGGGGGGAATLRTFLYIVDWERRQPLKLCWAILCSLLLG